MFEGSGVLERGWFLLGPELLPGLSNEPFFSVAVFLALAASLYYFATKPIEMKQP